MITVEKLREFGCDVNDGLARCMNNEQFYLRLVNSLLSDNKVQLLEEALNNNDLQKGFELAHALKGVYANLSITPLLVNVSELTELLRNKTEMDYQPLMAEIKKLYQQFLSLAD